MKGAAPTKAPASLGQGSRGSLSPTAPTKRMIDKHCAFSKTMKYPKK